MAALILFVHFMFKTNESRLVLNSLPPRQVGPLAKRERFLAYRMLLPTFLIVLSIVLLPLLANFWISFKAVELGDLRSAHALHSVSQTV